MNPGPTPIALRIPPEILVQIVQLCSPSKITFFEAHENNFPWIYTHVCRYWRHIINNTPSLWNEFTSYPPAEYLDLYYCLDNPPASEDSEEWHKTHLDELKPKLRAHWANELTRIALQVERAQKLPLIVGFGNTEAVDTGYQPAMECFAKQHSRWGEVDLRLSPAGFHRLSHLCETWTFDELRQMTLAISIYYEKSEEGEPDDIPDADMFKQAPKLNLLTLIGISLSPLNFPWGQLTALVLENVFIDENDLPNVLSQTTLLEDFTLDRSPIQYGPIAGPISLPYLKNFNFRGGDDPDELIEDGSFFSSLHFPSLTHLSVHAPPHFISATEAAITSGRWSHELVSFRVQEYRYENAHAPSSLVGGHALGLGFLLTIGILEHLTALRSLCIVFPYEIIGATLTDLDILLDWLQPPERANRVRPGLCPNLETLELANISLSRHTSALLLKTLSARVPNTAPATTRSTVKRCLQEVVLVAQTPTSPDGLDPQLFSKSQLAELSEITSDILFDLRVGEFWPPASVETLKKLAEMRQVVKPC